MTEQEKKVLNMTADLWNEFLKLESMHPTDQQDYCFHVHALQNIILSREGLRSLKELPDPKNWAGLLCYGH